MAGRHDRISIGFHGGQVLGARVTAEDLAALRQALSGATSGSGGWHELPALEGPALVDLGRVAYVRVETDEHRVGF